ncbi:MAG: dienelactone hydrolase family protein, partial [Acidimicrobiales bacterium]
MGTTPIADDGTSVFRDRYRVQYQQTVEYLDMLLEACARNRRSAWNRDRSWLADKRQLLMRRTGFRLFEPHAGVTATLGPTQPTSPRRYRISPGDGRTYCGELWDPPEGTIERLVVLGNASASQRARLAGAYRDAGSRVVAPSFPSVARTPIRQGVESPVRFGDDEYLHLMAWAIGGSLVALEAAEIVATVASFADLADGGRVPVVLDLEGRQLLTAVVTAALSPDLVSVLIVRGQMETLDSQHLDRRVNTIWAFHQDFDGLTLISMAEKTAVLFIEDAVAPSKAYSLLRTALGEQPPSGGSPQRTLARIVQCSGGDDDVEGEVGRVVAEMARIPEYRPMSGAPAISQVGAVGADANTEYAVAISSSIRFLTSLHEESRRRRTVRWRKLAADPSSYRDEVAASRQRVLGPSLSLNTETSARTRLCLRTETYDAYEVLLATACGVDACGYLLVPNRESPRLRTGSGPWPGVIVQHGRGGRPEALIGTEELPDQWIYDRAAERLAQKGYVVFVPFMNWGWGQTHDRDRLAKRAYALGIAPNRPESVQLAAIVAFLRARPEVRDDSIAFYGLSFGGHAALWLVPDEPSIASVVVSGHFNQWQRKLFCTERASALDKYVSFVCVDEGYDMFYFNVLNELDHAQLLS